MFLNTGSLGLVILGMGVMGVIVSFLITDRKKYFMGLGLAGILGFIGVCQYLSGQIQKWNMNRRFRQARERTNMSFPLPGERRFGEGLPGATPPPAASQPSAFPGESKPAPGSAKPNSRK